MPRYAVTSGTRPTPSSDRILSSYRQPDPLPPTAGAEGDRTAAAPGAVGAGDHTAAVQAVPFHAQHVLNRTPPTSSAVQPLLPDTVVGTLVPSQSSLPPRDRVPTNRPMSLIPNPSTSSPSRPRDRGPGPSAASSMSFTAAENSQSTAPTPRAVSEPSGRAPVDPASADPSRLFDVTHEMHAGVSSRGESR